MTQRFRPTMLAGALVAAALMLTGCTAPRPIVTFFGNRTSIDVQAEFWCDVDLTALTVVCPTPPDTGRDGHLSLAPGQPLQINVPTDIGDTPWVIVFEYTDAARKAQKGRSEVFRDGRLAYTLPSLGPGFQLTRVEVQSGLVPTQDSAGNTGFAASRTWVLVISPKAPTSASS